MKKLMIAFAAAAMAVCANAATYSWNASNSSNFTDGGTDLSGVNIYIFDANAYASSSIAESLSAGTLSVLDNAIGMDVLDSGMIMYLAGEADTVTGISAAKVESTDYMKMYAAILDSNSAATAKNFAIVTTDPIELSDDIKGGAEASFDFYENTEVSWNTIPSTTPEPTSGLLLLIGVAGLALRRRRA